jgi:hypothetical protein
MCVCAYILRHWDVPAPVVVVICFTPAFVVSGFLVARRHGSEQGVAAGAAATATGWGVVFLTTAGFAAVNQSELAGLGWLLFGLAFSPVALMYGVLWGCAGAGIARSLQFLRGHGR